LRTARLKQMSRLLLLILIASLLTTLPLALTAWAKNEASLGLISLCFQPGAPYAQPLSGDAWRQAIASRCRGDAAGEESALEAALLQGSERINLVRAVMPQDVSLARFAARQFSDKPDVQFWLADNLAAGDVPGAIQVYEQGLHLEPTAILQWRILADLYQNQGDWQKAIQAYDRICFWDDSEYYGCYRAGRLFYQHQLYDLAIKRLRCTVEQEPEWAPGNKALAKALLAAGRAQEARPYLEFLSTRGDPEAKEMLQEMGGR
jgi:tetratricopeptide (TPR) repeat protein